MTPDEAPVIIRPISQTDAGEVLTLQRAAFVSEAQIYGDPNTAPLVQTLDQLEAELRNARGFVAIVDGRIVGAIRARQRDDVLMIGRIAVAPDQQGAGIGQRLLAALEESTTCSVAELFTGSLSKANIELYSSLGYRESERVEQGDGTAQVFMRKMLTHPKN